MKKEDRKALAKGAFRLFSQIILARYNRSVILIMNITFWTNEHGETPVITFLSSLDPQTQHHIRIVFGRMEQLSFPDFIRSKHVRSLYRMYEFKVPFRGMAYRFFFTFNNHICVIVHAWIKKTQKTPPHEIAIALARISKII